MTCPRTHEDYLDAKARHAYVRFRTGSVGSRALGMDERRPRVSIDPLRGCANYILLLTLTIPPVLGLAAGFTSAPPSTLAVTSAALGVFSSVTATARLDHSYPIPTLAAGVNPAPAASFIANYIASVEPTCDAELIAYLMLSAGEDAGISPLILVALARYESRFRVDAVGSAGERGLLQIHPCHKKAMKRAGLDFYSESDRLTFACILFKDRGWQPWSVRNNAKKLYTKLTEDFNGE